MKRIARRSFLKRSAALGIAPWIVPGSALGLDEKAAASERLTMGVIGTGGMGKHDMASFVTMPDVQIVAVCDADIPRGGVGKQLVDAAYGNTDCKYYQQFPELLGRDDIDVVLIATPDHWHAQLSILAAKAGKDIYCEKPISLTVAEGRAVVNAMKRYNVIYQSGTQRRSIPCFRFAVDAAREGLIGELHTIRTFLGAGREIGPQPEQPVPEGFDYNMWLGPAPYAPYTPLRCHGSFRWIYDYSGGQLTDIGAHFNDLAQWGHDSEVTGPLTYEAFAVFPREGLFNTPVYYTLEANYKDGVRLIFHDTEPRTIRFEGTEGWVSVDDNGLVQAEPASLLEKNKTAQQDYSNMNPHHRNFLDCVKSRRQPIASPEVAHRSTTICHIGNICMRLGRPLEWDPEKERFKGDRKANAMLSRERREPWELPV